MRMHALREEEAMKKPKKMKCQWCGRVGVRGFRMWNNKPQCVQADGFTTPTACFERSRREGVKS